MKYSYDTFGDQKVLADTPEILELKNFVKDLFKTMGLWLAFDGDVFVVVVV